MQEVFLSDESELHALRPGQTTFSTRSSRLSVKGCPLRGGTTKLTTDGKKSGRDGRKSGREENEAFTHLQQIEGKTAVVVTRYTWSLGNPPCSGHLTSTKNTQLLLLRGFGGSSNDTASWVLTLGFLWLKY